MKTGVFMCKPDCVYDVVNLCANPSPSVSAPLLLCCSASVVCVLAWGGQLGQA